MSDDGIKGQPLQSAWLDEANPDFEVSEVGWTTPGPTWIDQIEVERTDDPNEYRLRATFQVLRDRHGPWQAITRFIDPQWLAMSPPVLAARLWEGLTLDTLVAEQRAAQWREQARVAVRRGAPEPVVKTYAMDTAQLSDGVVSLLGWRARR